MMDAKTVAVVGAGITGATAAHILARNGFKVEVFEKQDHVGGNCHTARDPSTNVMVHTHGPHIFHTNDSQVWGFVKEFADMVPYIQRTKAISENEIFSFPINLHTLSQLYGRPLTPGNARKLIADEVMNAPTAAGIDTMEGQLLATVGHRVYRRFFRDYTLKQWGREPRALPASVATRIPVRFDYNDNAFNDRYQGIPRLGYTAMIEEMLDHRRINVRLNDSIGIVTRSLPFEHVIYTGAIDEALDYCHGYLPYRTLNIAHEVLPEVDDFQGCSVINCCDAERPWTRQTEHKHFTPWEVTKGTVVSREFSVEWQPGLTRYYPVRLAQEERTLALYEAGAQRLDDVTFMGRLGRFQYLNMDQAVAAAIRGTRALLPKLS